MANQQNSKTFVAFTAAIAFGASLASADAFAAQPAVNTGSTSFMDGFGDPTGYGLLYLNYLSWIGAGSLKDVHGDNVPVFQDPKLNVLVDLNQFLYSFKVPEGAFAQPGLDLIVPLVDTNASSGANGGPVPPLNDNGFGLGDLTFGPFLQFKPILVEGHPIFAHRIEFDLLAPTGKYDSTKDVNPGHNTWGINPYWAATLIPVPRLEISTRINYLYNFKNSNPGQGRESTQSGQAIFDNFTASFEILPHNDTRTGAISLRAGLNGYYFKQISEDKTNGASDSNSKEQVLGIGPGAMWIATHEDAFWLNVYFETAVENRFASHVVQIRWAHAFASF